MLPTMRRDSLFTLGTRTVYRGTILPGVYLDINRGRINGCLLQSPR